MKHNDHQSLQKMRHSAAHLLASAVQELYPEVKLGIGPATSDGFYYDFDFSLLGSGEAKGISENDLPEIEKKMREIKKRGDKFERKEISIDEAKKIFQEQPYKLELILQKQRDSSFGRPAQKGKVEKVSIYQHGKFVDFCRGPHVASTAEIGAFKLLSVAGAYWRGSEKNKMLTRIYGTAFPTPAELREYLKKRHEAEKRDHKKLGKELDLFFINETVGQGLPLFTEKGTVIRRELERWVIDEEISRGYTHVLTPDLARTRLYEISGHYPYYKNDMYPVMEIDNTQLVLRPMTCPHHFMIYQHRLRSHRDLPLRIAEVAKLYRYEQSGELSGLQRVRSFCLADAHIFARANQAGAEVAQALDLIDYLATTLGLKKGQDYWYRLSLGDPNNQEKYYDNPAGWQMGEKTLKEVLDKRSENYVEAKGEAAFYGPKIDVQMKNVYGKEDTAFTVQYDFCLPARFRLEYVNEKGKKEQPVVIHRSSIGAIERVMAYLIELYAGAFPVWLSPVQAVVIPVSIKQHGYAKLVLDEFNISDKHMRVKYVESQNQAQPVRESFPAPASALAANTPDSYPTDRLRYRITADLSNETLNKKIRNAQLQKIPYMLIVGSKEEKGQMVSVRLRTGEDLGAQKIDAFKKRLFNRILTRALSL